jgi:hypothetical protein
MAATPLTQNSPNINPGIPLDYNQVPVAASTHIYEGAFVADNGSGYAVPMADTAGYLYLGRAQAEADNSAGAAGAIAVNVVPWDADPSQQYQEIACNAGNAARATYLDKHVFFVDDNSVNIASGTSNTIIAGRCINVLSTNNIIVDMLDRFAPASS